MHPALLGPTLALSLFGAAEAAPPGCAEAIRAVSDLPYCSQTSNGVALATTEERARELSHYAQAGEDRFRQVFGRSIEARYAVFDHETQEQAATRQAALAAVGFEIGLPLASEALQVANLRRAVGQSARNQALARGLAPDDADAASETAVERATAARTPRRDATFVPHELGHKWYAGLFWADVPPHGGQTTYGTPAPDWLDEAAAIMIEDDEARTMRRREFAAGLKGISRTKGAAPAPAPMALLSFLTATHPALPGIASAPPAGSAPSTGGVRTMAVQSNRAQGLFYPQAMLLAEYLIDRSATPTVLAAISEALRGGQGLEAWLAMEGGRLGLPTSVEALAADWTVWSAQISDSQ